MKNKLFFYSLMLATILLNFMNSATANEQICSDDMTFSIPSLISITNNNSTLSSSATVTSASTITLNSPLTAIFDLSTTEPGGVDIMVSATAPVNSNSITNALLSNKIVFTKADGSTLDSAVNNILDGASTIKALNNPNAIGFTVNMYPVVEYTDNTYDFVIDKHIAHYMNNLNYLHLRGSETLTISISGDSLNDTFGMNDKAGNYTATLTLTQVVGSTYVD